MSAPFFILTLIILMVSCKAPLQVGQPAPDFTLSDQFGDIHRLSDYREQRIVLYFYPKDDTPGCTREACSIRDSFPLFLTDDIQVFGISYDTEESHRDFSAKFDLPFTLLSDSDRSVTQKYAADGQLIARRITYLIDVNGQIAAVLDDVDVNSHGAEILEAFSTR